MGSPKAARSKASQASIWRRKIGAPFVVVLVAAVLVLVAFTGQFAQGPDGQPLGPQVQTWTSSSFFPCHLCCVFLLEIFFQLPRDSLRYVWRTAYPGASPQIKARRLN
jgi:hypothetical protein